MECRPLGRTGLSVSKLCLGAMMFGDWGNKDHDESIRIIHRARDAGINFIDTADACSQGESEQIVGKALAGGRRDDIVLATKVWFPMGDEPDRRGASHRWIIREVENSLRRLGTDWSDLYQIHRFEPDTDIEKDVTFVNADHDIYGEIDDAYRAKYRRYSENTIRRIASPEARSTTIKLVPRTTRS
jgi:aryl-alcohol dehydrogenase-like predicted oxidoreductase